MKMIYVGSLSQSPDRDSGWIHAFERLGWEVIPFSSDLVSGPRGIAGRFLRRLNLGPENRRMQRELLSLAEREKPAWLHFRLPLGIGRGTLLALKKMGVVLTEYFNDDAFSRRAPWGLNWKFRSSLPLYDGHFVYRAANVAAYLKAGGRHVEHCSPAYDPRRHRPARIADASLLADAAFIGHWEDDWRVDCLDGLARRGFSVILRGGGWDDAVKGREIGAQSPIRHALGNEYNHVYANVCAGLCFFSKINNDTWTERALEIVAVGGLLVCERTAEAEGYFRDREEACFFSSVDELAEILSDLKRDPEKRERIRAAGYRRLLAGSSTIHDRACQIVRVVHSLGVRPATRNSEDPEAPDGGQDRGDIAVMERPDDREGVVDGRLRTAE